jgi:hypothetical protein
MTTGRSEAFSSEDTVVLRGEADLGFPQEWSWLMVTCHDDR